MVVLFCNIRPFYVTGGLIGTPYHRTRPRRRGASKKHVNLLPPTQLSVVDIVLMMRNAMFTDLVESLSFPIRRDSATSSSLVHAQAARFGVRDTWAQLTHERTLSCALMLALDTFLSATRVGAAQPVFEYLGAFQHLNVALTSHMRTNG
jgi:hypothetical protein